MKVGNIVNSLEVVDVKRVNKMNIIQFTKAVSEYIDQGYKLDVNSARQIGLVLMVDLYKTEAASSVKVGSTNATSTGEGSVGELFVVESNSVETAEEAVAEVTEQPKENVAVEPVEEVVKKPTQRTKKTT